MGLILLRDKIELQLHPSPDFVSDTIRRTKDFWEADILDFIGPRIRGGLVVDVGAMIGNHMAHLAILWEARVLAFEPTPANLEVLHVNAKWLCQRGARIHVQERALSDVTRQIVMRSPDPANLGHSVVVATDPEQEEGEDYVVDAYQLDEYKLKECALLKIDVEHHEPNVLRGAQDTIKRCKPFILIEDWTGGSYATLLPGYHVMKAWQHSHQTYLYAPD